MVMRHDHATFMHAYAIDSPPTGGTHEQASTHKHRDDFESLAFLSMHRAIAREEVAMSSSSRRRTGLLHLGDVAARARDNDEQAWNQLVGHFTPLLHSIARQYRLCDDDTADAVQSTWLRFVQHFDGIRTPDAIGGWLVTTCRRECLRILRHGVRHMPVPLEDLDGAQLEPHRTADDPVDVVLRRDLQEVVRGAVDGLPAGPRRVLFELLREDTHARVSYASVSAQLSIPVGSLGPMRQRAIARLRRDPNILGLGPEAGMLQ
jgi:RNA polymerase sigma factor (sigma-70 family)